MKINDIVLVSPNFNDVQFVGRIVSDPSTSLDGLYGVECISSTHSNKGHTFFVEAKHLFVVDNTFVPDFEASEQDFLDRITLYPISDEAKEYVHNTYLENPELVDGEEDEKSITVHRRDFDEFLFDNLIDCRLTLGRKNEQGVWGIIY
jgi:hypothetical protein